MFAVREPVLFGEETEDEEVDPFSDPRETLVLWYNDEVLTDYLNREAARFGDSTDDVRVVPVLVSGLNFLESVAAASATGENPPDLYITTHDNLEKAALAGLTNEVERAEDNLRGDNFSPAALSSVTWHDKRIAYPFYGETIALLYNRTYLEEEVKRRERERREEELLAQAPEDSVYVDGEALTAEMEFDDESLDAMIQEILPATLEDLLYFAGNYNAPEGVDAVFTFDVNDLFTTYFFAGDAMDVGGPSGDNSDVIDIYNGQTLMCMDIYQQLGQFFAVESGAVSGESVLRDLISGKTVFTISTTEAVRRVAEAQAAGECDYRIDAAPLFSLMEDIPTRALSVTNCIVVNGFSNHLSESHRFARFLLDDGTDALYERAGKMAAKYRAAFGDDPTVSAMMRAYETVYENSVPMPKMLETSNYWIRLETAFTDIWNGAEINGTMKQVAEQLLTQVRGTPVTLDPIPDPPKIVISDELTEDEGD